MEQLKLEETLKDHLVQHFAGKGAYMKLSSSISNHILEVSGV